MVRPLRALRRRLKGGFGGLPADRVEAYRKRLNELEIDGERIAQEAMSALLQFFLSYMMAMLAFWVLEVSTYIFILYAFEYIASGHMFPLDILPKPLEQALYLTPFPYQMGVPAGIYMGKISGAELVTKLIMQAGWVVLAYLLARFAWNRGIRKYSAVGG